MNTSADQTSVQAAEATPGRPRKSRVAKVIWLVLALLIAFLATGIYLPPHIHLSVPKFFAIWLGGTLLGYVGVRLGDAVRRVARPDVIVTPGRVSDALWARICWGIGPQIVGLYLGAVTGTSILVGWLA
ncbi:hypothetical protein ACTU9R_22285 [Burkholderia gladioli]|uniref:hypothetical protein n=1 Tax=Burkholderia gladioli TaxID=28095 RepID=UPI003FA6053C